MATLQSEDQDCPSTLNITAADIKELVGENAEKQKWQNVFVALKSGKRSVSTLENEDCMLCRSPTDEVTDLAAALTELADGKREQLLFEPSEPSFELSFERTRRGGIKVEAWLDAGNGTTGIYTWDACGSRFYTTSEKLKAFADELAAEFAIF